mmetsp:Transcript_49346/g.138197  ORF Transcript_49346/g.138197 Transcript_49346/m.138197 type:complete len:225 (-) Transcript_49346:882-1556(-)
MRDAIYPGSPTPCLMTATTAHNHCRRAASSLFQTDCFAYVSLTPAQRRGRISENSTAPLGECTATCAGNFLANMNPSATRLLKYTTSISENVVGKLFSCCLMASVPCRVKRSHRPVVLENNFPTSVKTPESNSVPRMQFCHRTNVRHCSSTPKRARSESTLPVLPPLASMSCRSAVRGTLSSVHPSGFSTSEIVVLHDSQKMSSASMERWTTMRACSRAKTAHW